MDTITPLVIPDFLHDAILERMRWDPVGASLSLEWSGALRKGTQGEELTGHDVTLLFRDVERLSTVLAPSDAFTRISELPPAPKLGVEMLGGEGLLVQHSVSASLAIARGDAAAFSVRVLTSGSAWGCKAWDVTLSLSCAQIEATSGGNPLPLEQWGAERRAWWEGWRVRWGLDSEEATSAAAPDQAEAETPPAETPPDEPGFALGDGASDVPREILEPLRDKFEGLLARDWTRMARAYVHGAVSGDDAAHQQEEVADSERWGYARAVDAWWVEDERAMVCLRGIEYSPPLDGEPGNNCESVWTFGLARRAGRWVITAEQQGWPPYGSAPALPKKQKPWLADWKSGPVLSTKKRNRNT